MHLVPSLAKRWFQAFLGDRGRRLTRLPQKQYLQQFRIDCLLDVGANVGQFATEVRRLGYSKRIESFEPLSEAYRTVAAHARGDSGWNAHHYALGDRQQELEINVSANLPSSSFLAVSKNVENVGVDLKTVSRETVKVKTLDAVFSEVVGDSERVYMKVDTQGFERNVVQGGIRSLEFISVVQMELSLVSNYEGEALIEEMIAQMRGLGFTPWWIMDGFREQSTLQLFQADVFFVNNRSAAGVSDGVM